MMSGVCNWSIRSYLWLMFLVSHGIIIKLSHLWNLKEPVGLGIQLVYLFKSRALWAQPSQDDARTSDTAVIEPHAGI